MWTEHQSHLLGHLASLALRRLDPCLSVAASKNVTGKFWVPLFTPELPAVGLLELHNGIRRLASQAQVFRHRQLSLAELQNFFPGQTWKQSEGRGLSRDGTTVAGYELDGGVDFCDCRRKELADVRDLVHCQLSRLTWEKREGVYCLVGEA
jgi:hypothetical protein